MKNPKFFIKFKDYIKINKVLYPEVFNIMGTIAALTVAGIVFGATAFFHLKAHQYFVPIINLSPTYIVGGDARIFDGGGNVVGEFFLEVSENKGAPRGIHKGTYNVKCWREFVQPYKDQNLYVPKPSFAARNDFPLSFRALEYDPLEKKKLLDKQFYSSLSVAAVAGLGTLAVIISVYDKIQSGM